LRWTRPNLAYLVESAQPKFGRIR